MEAPVTKAIIFDCIGVLYGDNQPMFRGAELNTELITLIDKYLKPHYKIGLLSNIDRLWIDTFISKHNLMPLFDAVVVSGDEGLAKPDSQIYLRVSEKLAVEPQSCLMVDDLVENCDGAVRAGMRSIVFKSTEQLRVDLQELDILLKSS